MLENRKELILFLLEAKKNTYASGGNEVEPTRPGSREHRFASGEYLYVDSYFGGSSFIGQEAVWFREVPIWGMNYYGRSMTDRSVSGVPEFLKECLLHVPEFAPYRGPRYYRSGALDYSCSWAGDLSSFQGREIISSGGTSVYELFFHGGEIIR